MTAASALLAAVAMLGAPNLDARQLPPLPQRGLARQAGANVLLETMNGRPIGVLKKLSLAPEAATSHGLVLRDARGRLFELDLYEHRLRRVFPLASGVHGCRVTDARVKVELMICGRTIQTARARGSEAKPLRQDVARAPARIGHWERAQFAPRGSAFVAQWSAECESPVAFLIANGRMRPYGGRTMRDAPPSKALGWLPNGSAVVYFPAGACGGAYHSPGIYAVPRTGKPRLLRRTSRTPYFVDYGMWGG